MQSCDIDAVVSSIDSLFLEKSSLNQSSPYNFFSIILAKYNNSHVPWQFSMCKILIIHLY